MEKKKETAIRRLFFPKFYAVSFSTEYIHVEFEHIICDRPQKTMEHEISAAATTRSTRRMKSIKMLNL